MNRRAWILTQLVVSMALVEPASAVPTYSIVPLGLRGGEHTDGNGQRNSTATLMNEAGQVIGRSERYPYYPNSPPQQGYSAWLYDGERSIKIGLTGPEHTRSDGFKESFPEQLNEAGQVLGLSRRYVGDGSLLSFSVWLYDGATTIDIGLTGPEHTRSDGHKSSSAGGLNEAGQVSGYSQRFNGGYGQLGYTAWLYDGASTIEIGLAGSEYTGSGGLKSSTAVQLNEAGQVRGYSGIYNGGDFQVGNRTWLYNGTNTIPIGLAGPEHIGSGGVQTSYAYELNEAGQVHGYSRRFNGGSTDLGFSAWLFNGTTTVHTGLTGPEHTRNDGYKNNIGFELNEAGQMDGRSFRYNGGSVDLGWSFWLYDGTTTRDVGLTDSEHTRSDGYKFSSLTVGLNEAGRLGGYSYRYNGGSTQLGQSAWYYDGATTLNIGFTGAEHTRNDGYKYSQPAQQNEAGQVRGHSQRFNGGSTDLGRTAWLYDGTTTIDISLTGAEYTRGDGYRYSEAQWVTEAGQVSGFSRRYNGGSTQLGQDAWLYDSTLDQTFVLQLSTRSNGFAHSAVTYTGEDGVILGTYTLFDSLDNDLGNRVFYFTIADGLHDLGSLVHGGLSNHGWDFLASTIRTNGLGHILGTGKPTSQYYGQYFGLKPYLLTRVPEPSSFVLILFSTAGLLVFPHRQVVAKNRG